MKVVRKILILLSAFGFFLGSFSLEYNFARSTQIIGQQKVSIAFEKGPSIQVEKNGKKQAIQNAADFEMMMGDTIDSADAKQLQINFGKGGLIRLAPHTKVQLVFADHENNAFVFELIKGRVWVHSLLTDALLNVVAGGAYIIPEQSIFDLYYDGSKVQAYGAHHSVIVGLVPLDHKVTTAYRYASPNFINSYLLTQGNQTTLFDDKIKNNAETLKQLFYSKLIKEVQYGLLAPEELNKDLWFKQNIDVDKDFLQQSATLQLREIRDRGLKVASLESFGYQVIQAQEQAADALTFSRAKATDHQINNLFGHVADSEYLLLFGRSTEAKDRLDHFRKLIEEDIQVRDTASRDAFIQRLRKEYDALSFVSALEPLYLAKTTLRDVLLNQLGHSDDEVREKFLLVRDQLNDVYDLTDSNVQLARLSLEQYYKYFSALLEQERNRLELVRNILAADNQILDNLFRQYPEFYKDSYFAMKNRLEQEWLNLMTDGDQKNEEKQTIISNKIDFLKQLKVFFLEDKIALDDARQIVFRLFREADELQLPPDAQVAVSELFAKRLEDFGVFFRYLNSPEYVGTTLHGNTRQEQFQQFLLAQQEQISIDQIRKEILGDQVASTLTVENILNNARNDFASLQITDLEFGSFSEVTNRYLPINQARLEGVSFQARYDWDQKLLDQIVIDGEKVADEKIQLSDVPFFLQSKNVTQETVPSTQDTSVPTPVSQEVTLSKTELVARVLLLQKLKNSDLAVTQDKIEIIDLSQNLFKIQSATFISDKSFTIAFTFDGKQNIVYDLVLLAKSGDQKLSEEFKLEDLLMQIKAQPLKVKRK